MKQPKPRIYDHSKIEKKWQKYWESKKIFQAKEKGKKYYSLIEFPYPSGDGLHVGHPRPYIGMDVISNKRRMQGYNVLYPIGWDAFGLPTENYAIKTGIQPAIVTKKNTDNFRRQIKNLGISFDWSREINTTDPKYYKWTQWIFLQFLKNGLAYKKKMDINWCPKDLIGLANEEVIDGKCERCGTPVVKKEKEQWMLAITKYADRLLNDLDARLTPMGDYVEMTPDGPCFNQVEGLGAIEKDKPFVERNAIMSVVKHWSEDKYIGLKWKKVAWQTFITGGPEGDQTPEEAARMEIMQETGYQNLRLVRKLPCVHSKFFHVPKQINRNAHFDVFYFELENGDKKELSKEEEQIHEVKWLTKDEMSKFLTTGAHIYVWNKFLNPESDGLSTWTKPLFEAKEAIKDTQRNWIGKSEGAEIEFDLKLTDGKQRFVLLHGFEGHATTNFFPWLKKEFEKQGAAVECPELPNTMNPSEDEQVDFVIKNCHFDENTVIIGHSLGAVLAQKVIMKLNRPISGLLVVAPAIDPKFHDTDFKPYWKNYTWNFDYEQIKKLTSGRIAVLADTQEKLRTEYSRELAKNLGASCIEVKAAEEHFCAEVEPDILKCCTPSVSVFTTRPDTLYGVTYIVLSPENFWISELLYRLKNRAEVEKYIADVKKKTDIERTAVDKEKTGVKLDGLVAINPATKEEIPVWIGDYVLADYGTGAVMAVPAHDERDYKFAKKYNLPIKEVLVPSIIDVRNPPRLGKKSVERKNVHAIARDVKTGKYLALSWPNYGWTTFPMGGVEDGEDVAAAAVREIKEETGFTNVKVVKVLEGQARAEYFAAHKDQNRISFTQAVLLDLLDHTQVEVSKEESDMHNIIWLDAKDLNYDKMTHAEIGVWKQKIEATNGAYTGEGVLINSDKFTGKNSEEIKKVITESVGGKWVTKFKLRDWVFSRQRYWGEPIPVVHCPDCGIMPLPEKELPLKLPPVKNYKPTETGESPLAAISKWVNTKCPKCKGPARRETDTMPNWAGSSWYYLRYTDPKNAKAFADKKKIKYWTPVDWYNGGMEHTTLHLLYSRFWHKFLYDLKLVPTREPYQKRTSHGLILAQGGEKMSKSKGNVINPDTLVKTVGADALRTYEMFMGPFEQHIAWDENGIVGTRRFIEKVWRLYEKVGKAPNNEALIHKTIKKVSDDIEGMRFNTAISSMMIAVNELEKQPVVSNEDYAKLLQLLAPFAPHVAEELWAALGNKKSIIQSKWPVFDPAKIVENTVKIMVQVNGKTRSEFEIGAHAGDDEVKNMALNLAEIKKWTENKDIKKVIVVKGRLINIVV